ncbi:MAG: radical SAM protein [candidate division WOR-3 bacterium]|nr:MAG: radical SAM protein [candidate division WOR-3 bacterium]
MIINEVKCKSILNKSGISVIDYSINPYYGCAHKCQYCYAVFMKRFTGHTEPWGDFVDVKINAAEVLARQLPRVRKRSRISFGTVCDPYQPLELKYQVTRKCLEILKPYRHRVSILTKSTIVIRDADILRKLHKVRVSFTITSMDEKVRKIFEPGAPPAEKRFKAIRTLAQDGIRTSVFVAPVIPYISDSSATITDILRAAKNAGAEYVMFDTLNPYPKVWRNTQRLIEKHFPDKLASFNTYYTNRKTYSIHLRERIRILGEKYGIEYKYAF